MEFKYDFTTQVDRSQNGSEKWAAMKKINPQVPAGIVPFSVADMEFKNPPEIISGLQEYLENTILGYTEATDSYINAVLNWQEEKHGWRPEKEWVVTSPGVVPAFFGLVKALTNPGDGVLILTPVYYPFFTAMERNGRQVVKSQLAWNGKCYTINFKDFEEKAKLPNTKVFLLCSPHNPVGRVWSRQELSQMDKICRENGVFVISDEIHNDLIMPGYHHTTFSALSQEALQNCAVCTAPSKTFNLAGMQTSNIFIANRFIRERFRAELEKSAISELNILGYKACELAYTKCRRWLKELLEVIDCNRRLVEDFLEKHLPMVKAYPLEGTYLQWLDFRGFGMDYKELEHFMQFEALLYLDEGYIFGEDGKGFERINLACPEFILKKALERLLKAAQKKGIVGIKENEG